MDYIGLVSAPKGVRRCVTGAKGCIKAGTGQGILLKHTPGNYTAWTPIPTTTNPYNN